MEIISASSVFTYLCAEKKDQMYVSILCLSARLCLTVQYSMCKCVYVCNSVISSSFKSCHRPDTIVRRAFHRQISDVPVIQSNYTERNRYCYTPGIDSRQNRKVKIRPHTHLQPRATCLESHAHTQTHADTHTQTHTHTLELVQLQYLGDNKSLQGSTASLLS